MKKSSAITLTDPQFEEIAKLFSLLADPSRLKILHQLMQRASTVGELVDELGLGQANVSKHLALLYSADLVFRNREGNSVRYALRSDLTRKLCHLVCGSLEEQVRAKLCQLSSRRNKP